LLVSTNGTGSMEKKLIDVIEELRKSSTKANPLRVLILGRSGKTSAALFLCLYFARKRLESKHAQEHPTDVEYKIPLICNIQALKNISRAPSSEPEHLLWFLKRQLVGYKCRHLANNLEIDLQDGKYLILFDFSRDVRELEYYLAVDNLISSSGFQLNEFITVCHQDTFGIIRQSQPRIFESFGNKVLLLTHIDEGELEKTIKETLKREGATDRQVERLWENIKVSHLVEIARDFPEAINILLECCKDAIRRGTDVIDYLYVLRNAFSREPKEYAPFFPRLAYEIIQAGGHYLSYERAKAIFQELKLPDDKFKEAVSRPFVAFSPHIDSRGSKTVRIGLQYGAQDYFTAQYLLQNWEMSSRDLSRYVTPEDSQNRTRWWFALYMLLGMLPTKEERDAYLASIAASGTISATMLAAWVAFSNSYPLPTDLKKQLRSTLMKNSRSVEEEAKQMINSLEMLGASTFVREMLRDSLVCEDQAVRQGAFNIARYIQAELLYPIAAEREAPAEVRVEIAKALGTSIKDDFHQYAKKRWKPWLEGQTANIESPNNVVAVYALYNYCQEKGTKLTQEAKDDLHSFWGRILPEGGLDAFLSDKKERHCLPFLEMYKASKSNADDLVLEHICAKELDRRAVTLALRDEIKRTKDPPSQQRLIDLLARIAEFRG